MPYSPDLNRFLTPGARYTDSEGDVLVIEPHALGDLVMPTGQVVAWEPYCGLEPDDPACWDAQPFTVAVPSGSYPVRAWVASIRRGETELERRVATLEVLISEGRAEWWELALRGNEPLEELDEGEFFGYPADAAQGSLADRAAVRGLSTWEKERFEEFFQAEPNADEPVPGAALVVTDPDTGANIACVQSGWGDGIYPTFFGYDTHGDITSVVTDFCLLPGYDVPDQAE